MTLSTGLGEGDLLLSFAELEGALWGEGVVAVGAGDTEFILFGFDICWGERHDARVAQGVIASL